MELDHLDHLAASAFDGYLVRKDLVRRYSRQYPVPTYVVEFLLGRYCATVDEAEIEEGASVSDLCLKLAKYFPSLEEDFHTLMIAVNAVQADWEYILSDGDKVDFISTLGGG